MDESSRFQTVHSSQVHLDDLTPMFRQFVEVKRQYPGVILLYRMGDFYETFFEDALIASQVLEITLTGREGGKLGRVPMAGVPVKTLDAYLPRLLNNKFKVAICEQVEDPALAKGLVERKVVRVLTAGTLTEQAFLAGDQNNYLAAVVIDGPAALTDAEAINRLCGLAYCDVTTGQFVVAELSWDRLMNELDRIRPSELLVKGRRQKPIQGVTVVEEWLPECPPMLESLTQCTALKPEFWDVQRTGGLLQRMFQVKSLESFGLDSLPLALKAAGAIAHYLDTNFIETLPRFDTIQRLHLSDVMAFLPSTRRNLELTTTLKTQMAQGSLFGVLNHTATPMGARLLREWIHQPRTDLSEIHSRHDAVAELVAHPDLLESIRQALGPVSDLERLGVRLGNLTAGPRDLVALCVSLEALPTLAQVLASATSFYLMRLQEPHPDLLDLCRTLRLALEESPPPLLKEGGLIKAGYSPELDKLRQFLADQEAWLERYEQAERERTGIKTLKVAYNNAFGYFIEISRGLARNAPTEYQRKQTLTNAERFTTEVLKAYERDILDARERQFSLEYNLFVQLRQAVQSLAPLVKDWAHRLAVLDVLQSFADVALERDYVRPVVDESLSIDIEDGRHPVIETLCPAGQFVANDCRLTASPEGKPHPQIMIITGPNMSGKSTYMRQTALIVLMTQMGSFVPAKSAHIGWVDCIYTRVGAMDDLASGQSTFMIEMTETAQILNGASRRSLVILDEVGRGTSTFDGVSIAWSVTEYLAKEIGARTLFATHYHELNTLETVYPQIRNARVCVTETEGAIEFLHRVEEGSAQKSYGIQVAKMAGLPSDVIIKASSLLSQMQKKALASVSAKPTRSTSKSKNTVPQMTLFEINIGN